MFKKLLVLMLALCLTASGLITVALAEDGGDDGLALYFEENFEEYEADVNVSSTTMQNFFICDYNSIGDGIICVKEAANGNLYLFSHVFTQVYTATPIVGAYEFSLDVHEAQGSVQSGIFVRAPKTNAAFYEADGHPDTSVCQAGLMLYPRSNQLGVNVKTYDENASSTAHLQNNTQVFALPEGASYPYNVKVTDTGSEIVIYVNGTLICRITFSDPDQVYAKHESTAKYFGTAKLYDAQGTEMATYANPLLCSDSSIFGWATRASNMIVDNVSVKVNKSYETLVAINLIPTKVTEKNLEDAKEAVAAARALFDALTEEEKALVINSGKLTKAEDSITELENATEAPTDPVTEPETDPVTEPVTDPVTESPTDEVTTAPDETPTEPVTEAPTDTEAEGNDGNTEVKVIDDSLSIWILIAIMIVAICAAAGIITVKVRK